MQLEIAKITSVALKNNIAKFDKSRNYVLGGCDDDDKGASDHSDLTEQVRSGEGCSEGLLGFRPIGVLRTAWLFFALTTPLPRDEALCMRCLDMADILLSTLW